MYELCGQAVDCRNRCMNRYGQNRLFPGAGIMPNVAGSEWFILMAIDAGNHSFHTRCA